jgi:hypothetical protein
MLAHAPTDNVERILLAELSDVYSSYFASRIQQNDYNDALAVIEEVRGRIEAQALLHHVYSRPHDPSPTERQLTALNLKLIDTEEPSERDRISRQIYDAELHLNTDSLEEETATQPVALNSLQHILKPDELFIEYVLASPKSYVLAVTNTTVRAYPLADRKKIELDAGAYRGSLQNRKADASAAARLYDSLPEGTKVTV